MAHYFIIPRSKSFWAIFSNGLSFALSRYSVHFSLDQISIMFLVPIMETSFTIAAFALSSPGINMRPCLSKMVSDEIYGVNIMDIKEIIKPREDSTTRSSPSGISPTTCFTP